MSSRIYYLIIAPVFITLLAASWKLANYDFSQIAPIEKVGIEGEFENISRAEFRKKVVTAIDGGYFNLDLDLMRLRLMGLPWVDDISVRRQWPSSLHIKMKEKRALAYWNDDAMVSERGEIFKPEIINRQLMMPKLNGPEGLHNKMWLFLVEVNKGFSAMGYKVVDLNLDSRRAWSLHFLSENSAEIIQVKLGRDYADERLIRFVEVFSSNKLDLKNIAVIDLRYPNGFAMKIKNKITSKHMMVREA